MVISGNANVSDPSHQQFAKDDDPPCFSNAPPRPEFEPTSISQYAPSMTTIEIVDRQLYAGRAMPTEPPPRDYFCLSFLTCLFCVWPIRFCAICASFETQNRVLNGDMEGARSTSRTALILNISSIPIGIGIIIFLIIYAKYGS